MANLPIGFAHETVGAPSSFQSLRIRYVIAWGIILPVGKSPDLLDFRAFSRDWARDGGARDFGSAPPFAFS